MFISRLKSVYCVLTKVRGRCIAPARLAQDQEVTRAKHCAVAIKSVLKR